MLTGKQWIGGEWVQGEAGQFQAQNPKNGQSLATVFSVAATHQAERAALLAEQAAPLLRKTSLSERAAFLRACADNIMALGTDLLECLEAETGYPRARAEMERGRTCNQLRMFADYIEVGDFLDARIDSALPDRQPIPRPDLRSVNQPIGPVVVFGASNFPLAFSVAGGDTASAFAAGCPVIVKGHPSHPGTSEWVAQAIAKAVEQAQLPAGTFAYLIDNGHSVGSQLVKADSVKAVAFTGSFAGGTALMALANARPNPIPVFAEMGSINPVFLLPKALQKQPEALAQGIVNAFTLGSGQFCVKPGFVIAQDSDALNVFLKSIQQLVEQTNTHVMLNERISQTYAKSIDALSQQSVLQPLASGKALEEAQEGFYTQTAAYVINAADVLAHPHLLEETFGPMTIVVRCQNAQEMLDVAHKLPGQLTSTVHCAEGETSDYLSLLDHLSSVSGRLVMNGYPTGVEVCHSMMHGGPFPAASDARFTSVGTNAIQRFLRPVCYQNYSDECLPSALKNHNPFGIYRLVNGVRTNQAL